MPDIDPRLVAALDEAAFAAARDSTATLAVFLRDERVQDWLAERIEWVAQNVAFDWDCYGVHGDENDSRRLADAILGREP